MDTTRINCVCQVRGIEAVTSGKRELSKGLEGMKTGRAAQECETYLTQGLLENTPLIVDSFSTFNIIEVCVRHRSKRRVQLQ